MLSPLQSSLSLHLCPQLGVAKYWQLIEAFGSARACIEECHNHAESLTGLVPSTALALLSVLNTSAEQSELFQSVKQEQSLAAQNGIDIICFDDPSYPDLLKQIRRPPPILYVKGDVDALSLPQISIVGSRSPSFTGQEITQEFSQALAMAGFTITSGLALGIDGIAHRAALEGNGSSVAVLGSGLLSIYPKRHVLLADQIVEKGGALVSEFPLLAAPQKHHFPQRNRVVSGLSYGVLVVEAALKSGSLITARFALEQDREVFAVPGSIKNPLAQGCHAMIKSGAKLVENVRDIVSELDHFLALHQEVLTVSDLSSSNKERLGSIALEKTAQQILNAIGYELTSADTLTERCGRSMSECSAELLQLEMQGLIENTGLGYIRL